MKNFLILLVSFISLVGCKNNQTQASLNKKENMENLEYLTIGGGCFWCVESCFNMLKGVETVESGYSGGHKENPTYEDVCMGETEHAEVVQIAYRPNEISFEQLMEVFFFLHDPTQLNRQGEDIGTQYRSVIFYRSEEEKQKAEQAIKTSEATGKWSGTYVTELAPFKKFWKAESYHQGYYKENPTQPYCSAVVGPKVAKFKAHFGALGWLK